MPGRTTTFEERFEAKIMPEPMSGCWIWTGEVSRDGYGRAWRDGEHVMAHRVAYEMHGGTIPEGKEIDHLCRTRCCVRPSHLEPVTRQVNVLRGVSTGAQAVRTNRCKRGHELTPENVHVYKGSRHCRTCNRERSAAWKAARA